MPSLLARATQLTAPEGDQLLADAINRTRIEALAGFVGQRQRDEAQARDHAQAVMLRALPEFDAAWADPTRRIGLAPPKLVLAEINRNVQSRGGRPVSVRSLSAGIRPTEPGSTGPVMVDGGS